MLESWRKRPENIKSAPSAGDIDVTTRIIKTLVVRDRLQGMVPEILKVLDKDDLFGISEEERISSIRTLTLLGERPSLDYLDAIPVLEALDEERDFSVTGRRSRSRTSGIALLSLNKRFAQRVVFVALAAATAWPTIIEPTYLTYFTSEGQAELQARQGENQAKKALEQRISEEKKAEEQRVAQEEAVKAKEEGRLKVVEMEKQTTLGLEPSSPSSSYFWRFRYLPPDPKIEYRPLIGEKNIKTYKDDAWLFIPNGTKEESSNMRVKFHDRSDGALVPKIVVTTPAGEQNWILRIEPVENIDTRVLEFESVKDGSKKYIVFKMPQPKERMVEITLMERVEKSSN